EARMVKTRAGAPADHAKGRMYLPRIQAMKAANEALLRLYRPADLRFAEGLSVHTDLMERSRVRPPTVVGQLLWDEHARATEQALLGKLNPMEALRESQVTVQRELDTLASKSRYPVVSVNLALSVGCAVFAALLVAAWLSWRRAKLGRM